MNLQENLNRIKEVMGLIKESVDTTELLNYSNEYINGHNCDEIYNGLLKYQNVVNNGEIKLDAEDKKTLDDSIIQIKTYKGFACGRIKTEMKNKFTQESKESPEKLRESMCWFSKNVYVKNLTVCQSTQNSETPIITKTNPVVTPTLNNNTTTNTTINTPTNTTIDTPTQINSKPIRKPIPKSNNPDENLVPLITKNSGI
jgi:hypothetical protein